MTIVNVDQLRDYMSGIGLDVDQTQAADDVLAGVQADLERYLARPLELRTVTEEVEMVLGGSYQTSVTPVVSTTSLWHVVRRGRLRPLGGLPVVTQAMLDTRTETVTYVGGYDGFAPEFADVRLAILRVAAREMEQRHDDTRSVKDLSTRNEGEMQLRQTVGWQPAELARFDRLRQRVVAT